MTTPRLSDPDHAAAREVLARVAEAIDAGELAASSVLRAGVVGGLAALGEPLDDDVVQQTTN